MGVSSLAAGHLTLVPQIIAELKKLGREDIIVIVGGVIPAQDYDELYRDGAAAIFGPVPRLRPQRSRSWRSCSTSRNNPDHSSVIIKAPHQKMRGFLMG